MLAVAHADHRRLVVQRHPGRGSGGRIQEGVQERPVADPRRSRPSIASVSRFGARPTDPTQSQFQSNVAGPITTGRPPPPLSSSPRATISFERRGEPGARSPTDPSRSAPAAPGTRFRARANVEPLVQVPVVRQISLLHLLVGPEDVLRVARNSAGPAERPHPAAETACRTIGPARKAGKGERPAPGPSSFGHLGGMLLP